MERLKEIWESYRYQLLILVAVLGLVGAWLMKRPAEAPDQIEQTMAIGSQAAQSCQRHLRSVARFVLM